MNDREHGAVGPTDIGTAITSLQNSEVKEFVRLRTQGAARRGAGRFVAEGLRLSCEVLAAGLVIHKLFYTQAFCDRHPREAAGLRAAAAQVFLITPRVADKLSDTKTAQGVFLVAEMGGRQLAPDDVSPAGRYVCLDSLQDPGNLGAIMRTAAALGADGALISDSCPDLFSPKVLRAAMGAVFTLPTLRLPTEGAIALLRGRGVRVYATLPGPGAQPLGGQLGQGCAVLFGNEGAGIDPATAALCDGSLRIPMAPGAESLNVSAAAAIFLWELLGNH